MEHLRFVLMYITPVFANTCIYLGNECLQLQEQFIQELMNTKMMLLNFFYMFSFASIYNGLITDVYLFNKLLNFTIYLGWFFFRVF